MSQAMARQSDPKYRSWFVNARALPPMPCRNTSAGAPSRPASANENRPSAVDRNAISDTPHPRPASRRLVCRERSIVGDDGGRFTTPPPSRLEARSRLGDKAANELGAPVASSIPAQLPGPEPASARKGREDDRAVLRWNRRVAGPA